jgi:hypothetical protein
MAYKQQIKTIRGITRLGQRAHPLWSATADVGRVAAPETMATHQIVPARRWLRSMDARSWKPARCRGAI